MMPYCEYHKCKKVAVKDIRLLRMWDSYNRNNTSHTQEIWLCEKHYKKISNELQVEELQNDKAE